MTEERKEIYKLWCALAAVVEQIGGLRCSAFGCKPRADCQCDQCEAARHIDDVVSGIIEFEED